MLAERARAEQQVADTAGGRRCVRVRAGGVAGGLGVCAIVVCCGQLPDAFAKPRRITVPQIVVVPRPWPPLVTVSVTVGAGSSRDPDGQEGLALLTAESSLRGAGDRDREALQAAFDALGASVQADADKLAVSWRADVVADRLDGLVALLADVVQRPRFELAEVEKVRGLQRADLDHLRDDDASLALEAMGRYLWRGTRLGRPTVGTPESLAKLGADAVRQWHQRHVTAATVRIGFAGPIDANRARALVQTHFSGLRAGTALPDLPAPRPEAAGRRLLLVDQPRRSQAQVVLALPVAPPGHKDAVALQVANVVLGGTFTSRLVHDLREQRGWSYHVWSALGTGPGVQVLQAGFGPELADVGPAIDLATRIVEELRQTGITAKELRFAKDHLQGAHRLALESADRELAERMRGALLGLPADELDTFARRVEAVDAKAILRALQTHLPTQHLVAVVVGPAAALRDKLGALRAQFAVEEMPADGRPEATTGQGAAVANLPALQPEAPPPSDDDDAGDEFEGPAEEGAPEAVPDEAGSPDEPADAVVEPAVPGPSGAPPRRGSSAKPAQSGQPKKTRESAKPGKSAKPVKGMHK